MLYEGQILKDLCCYSRINYLDLMKKYMMQSKDEHGGVPVSFNLFLLTM